MKTHSQSVCRSLLTKSTAALLRVGSGFGRLQALSFVMLFVGPLAMPLPGQYVYVVNSNVSNSGGTTEGSMSGYSIGPGGALTAIPHIPGGGILVNSVTVDRTSHFVYLSTDPDNFIAGWSIGAGGSLTSVAFYSSDTFAPTWITASPTRDVVYATSGNGLWTFSIGSDGQLTPLGSPKFSGALTTCVAVAPKGYFAYVTKQGGNTVSGYKIRRNGTPIELPGSPFSIAAGSPVSVAVSARFVFVVSGAYWLNDPGD